MLDSTPIESISSLRMRFYPTDKYAWRNSPIDRNSYFYYVLKELRESKPSEKKLLRELDRLENKIYVDSDLYVKLNLLKFRVSDKFGRKREAISAIKQVLMFEGPVDDPAAD